VLYLAFLLAGQLIVLVKTGWLKTPYFNLRQPSLTYRGGYKLGFSGFRMGTFPLLYSPLSLRGDEGGLGRSLRPFEMVYHESNV